MSKTIWRRLLARFPPSASVEYMPAPRIVSICHRSFFSTPNRKVEDKERNPPPAPERSSTSPAPATRLPIADLKPLPTRRPSNAIPTSSSLHPKASTSSAGMTNLLSSLLNANQQSRTDTRLRYDSFLSSDGSLIPSQAEVTEAHHFHIYATRHNTHITVTRPDRSPLISVSAGNIGFRHSGRKHFDSAFQLASYVLGQMNENGMTAEIHRLEVILRGFGAGREAVTKALLGTEGRFLRTKVIKVSDATRLKFGGSRSRKPRRLG